MRVIPFEWSADGTYCNWCGLDLVVDSTGLWMVMIGHHRLAKYTDQVRAKDINEARQRAQAAAIVQHQLRHQRS